MKFRNAFDGLAAERSKESGLNCGTVTRTQQNFKDECDINTIVNRFLKTGQMPTGMRLPQYGDFESAIDFQSAQNILIEGKKEFMKIPAKIRKQFDNDPQQFLLFVSDEKNREEMIRLGLIDKPVIVPSAPIPAPEEKK